MLDTPSIAYYSFVDPQYDDLRDAVHHRAFSKKHILHIII